LVGVVDCLLNRRRAPAGDARGDDVLRESSGELDGLQNKRNRGVRRCARSRWRGWERGGSLGLTVDGGFERTHSQIWRTPASDFVSLAALSAREREGKWRGGRGLFKGVSELETAGVLRRIEEEK
jgi:hypothetical protein